MDQNYSERYCAYVDVLGFRRLVTDLTRGVVSVAQMRELLTIVHEQAGVDTEDWETQFKAQSISDAVAISTVVSRKGLIEVLHALEELTVRLLRHGYFVRGALVKGLLYHDEKLIFGEALVRAFQFETEIVKYPRIMATRDVLVDYGRYLAEEGEDGSLANWLIQADDGPWFVDSLRATKAIYHAALHENVGRQPGYAERLQTYASIQDMIQLRLDESIDNPRHFEKVQWFANYWNRSTPYGLFGKKIKGPGLAEAAT